MTIRILTCDAGEEKPANETGPEGEGSPKAFWGNTGYPNLLYLSQKSYLLAQIRPGWLCAGIFNSPRGQTLSPRRRWGKGIAVDASCNTLPIWVFGLSFKPLTWKLCGAPVLAQAYPRHISSLTLTSLKIGCFTEYEPLKSFPPD